MTQPTETKSMNLTKTVTVRASKERAFTVFTERFGTWWPRGHHIGQAEMADAIIEPRQGGRWYERGVDGSECDWGTVLAYEPPDRVVVSWHLQGDFTYDPDPAKASEVEVTFVAEGPDTTTVVLDHRHIERHGDGAEAVRTGVSGVGGWGDILAGYAEKAAA